MEFWVPDAHELTADIPYSISLVDCDFLFPDCDLAFCNSSHKCCAADLNSHLSFGLDAVSGQSSKLFPGFRQ